MNYFAHVHYWTEQELKELKSALDASDCGRLPVFYQGKWVRFRSLPTYTFNGKDLVTVDGLDIEAV